VVVAREGADVWEKVVKAFSKEAGEGRAIEGLVATIESLGNLLAKHFPSDGTRKNELSDELRTEE
jgi:uncharacterized membrane protein